MRNGLRLEADEVVWEWVRCPLCGADETQRRVTDTVPLGQVRLTFTVVRCARCGLVYTNPRAHSRLLTPEPGGAARSDAASANKPVYLAGLAHLEAAGMRRAGCILDVGCARGDFLSLAVARGYQAVGVDINPRLAAEARTRGHEVHVGALERLDLEPDFDAVTLWDVIEHVPDPVGLLAACQSLLRPGGLLLLHTGNAQFQVPKARLLGRLKPGGGPYLIPYQHLTHFDPRTARLALRRAGFQPIEVAFAATLRYPQAWKCRAMTALNGVARAVHRLGGPLLTNAILVIGRRPRASR